MRSLLPLILIFLSLGAFAQIEEILGKLETTLEGPLVDCSEVVRRSTTREAPACARGAFVPLSEGTHRLMKRDGRVGPLGNPLSYETGDYLLRVLPNGRHQAILNLNFIKKEGSANTSDEEVQSMLRKSRECMQQMVPYLSSKGKNLEIVILTQAEVDETLPRDQRPAARTVRVSNEAKGFRGNAEHFGTNFDCTTIGHELLHHLGLCDEYHETEADKFAQWGCRPVTVRPSYMRDMHFAFNTVVPQTIQCECNETCKEIMKAESKTKDIFLQMNHFEIMEHEFRNRFCTLEKLEDPGSVDKIDLPNKAFIVRSESTTVNVYESRRASGPVNVERIKVTCTCPEDASGDYCRRAIGEVKRRSELNLKRATCPNGYEPTGDKRIGAHGNSRVEGDVLTIVTPGNGGSLMEPNHFAKVVAGNCRGGATQYEACASYAYISADAPQCKNMPPQCSDDDYYLGR